MAAGEPAEAVTRLHTSVTPLVLTHLHHTDKHATQHTTPHRAWLEPKDGGAGGASRGRKKLRGLDDDDDSSSSDDDDSGDDDSSGDGDGGGGGGVDDEEDEEFLEEVDRFEAAYNFR